MATTSHVDPKFQVLMSHEGLGDFESLWAMDRNWFEPPNARRGGVSGVCRKTLIDPATGQPQVFFFKFQQNHCYRPLKHALHGVPTARREAMHLLRFREYGISVPELVYYGEERMGFGWRAISVTRELEGVNLREYMRDNNFSDALASGLAELMYRIHSNLGTEHRSFRPKHLWVHNDQISILDLEHARPYRWWIPGAHCDMKLLLRTLRRECDVSRDACRVLLRTYLERRAMHSRLKRHGLKYGIY